MIRVKIIEQIVSLKNICKLRFHTAWAELRPTGVQAILMPFLLKQNTRRVLWSHVKSITISFCERRYNGRRAGKLAYFSLKITLLFEI